MNEWNIQSRAHACQSCERHFADKELFHTLLLAERNDYLRLDLCNACWQSQYSEGASDRKGFISQWQTAYQAPPAQPVDAIQKENAESLLRKLIEANDPKHGPVCYILAVMLERKRLLKVKEQLKRDGVRVFIYEHPKTGDIFTITDPNLQLNQLEQVQRDTADLLAHGLNPAAYVPSPQTGESEPVIVAEETATPASSFAKASAVVKTMADETEDGAQDAPPA